MIRHICMFTLKGDNKEMAVAEFVDKAQMLRELEMIKGFEVISNVANTPATNYDVSLIFDFESVEALNDYQKAPKHLEFGEYVKTVRIDRACIDYEF